MVIAYFVLSPKAVTIFDTFQIETFLDEMNMYTIVSSNYLN